MEEEEAAEAEAPQLVRRVHRRIAAVLAPWEEDKVVIEEVDVDLADIDVEALDEKSTKIGSSDESGSSRSGTGESSESDDDSVVVRRRRGEGLRGEAEEGDMDVVMGGMDDDPSEVE